MAEQEVAGRDLGHTARHHFVHCLAHHVEQRGGHGFRQAGLKKRHLFHGQAVRAQDGLVDRLRDRLAEVEVRIGALHQGAHDRLARMQGHRSLVGQRPP